MLNDKKVGRKGYRFGGGCGAGGGGGGAYGGGSGSNITGGWERWKKEETGECQE